MEKDKIVAYLISEAVTQSKPIIVNGSKNDTAVIEVELQDADEFNRNKRNYAYDVLDQGLNNSRIKELISRKSWVGEAGHPMGANLQRQLSIDTDRISHRILKWWWEGHKVKGLVETMNYGHGIQMRNFIRQGLETAFSLRAIGPVKKTPRGDVVQSPLTIMTYDWVFIPSHSKSYQQRIISGGSNDGVLTESYCLPILNEQAKNYIKNESKNFKMVAECLELQNGIITFNEKMDKVIYTTSKGDTKDSVHITMEDYISRELNEAFNSFLK